MFALLNDKVISFDIKCLFKTVDLNVAIYIILRRIFENNEIKTQLTRNEIKYLILLCTKDVHFTFNNIICKQVDGGSNGFAFGTSVSRYVSG